MLQHESPLKKASICALEINHTPKTCSEEPWLMQKAGNSAWLTCPPMPAVTTLCGFNGCAQVRRTGGVSTEVEL